MRSRPRRRRVSIGDVEGALSSDATIRNITISDKDGVWFRLDRVRFVWRRLALLSRRLEIDKLEIGKLEILRRPIPADETVAGADQPLLPELPVKVQIADFLLRELSLGAPVIGVGGPTDRIRRGLAGRSEGRIELALRRTPARRSGHAWSRG